MSAFEMCPTCGCCSIGRMGTCVGGCGPQGERRDHDRCAREQIGDEAFEAVVRTGLGGRQAAGEGEG